MTGPNLARRAHELLHGLPGMPEHAEATRRNHAGGLPNRPLQNRPLQNRPFQNRPFQNRPLEHPRIHERHPRPKVLQGWQDAIARFLSRQGG